MAAKKPAGNHFNRKKLPSMKGQFRHFNSVLKSMLGWQKQKTEEKLREELKKALAEFKEHKKQREFKHKGWLFR